jgi:hypothetical protein
MHRKAVIFVLATFQLFVSSPRADELKMDKETQNSYCVFKQQLFSVGAVLCRGEKNYLKCDPAASTISAVAHWVPISDDKGICSGVNARD